MILVILRSCRLKKIESFFDDSRGAWLNNFWCHTGRSTKPVNFINVDRFKKSGGIRSMFRHMLLENSFSNLYSNCPEFRTAH